MKSLFSFIILLFVLVTSVQAQDAVVVEQNKSVQFGFGVGLSKELSMAGSSEQLGINTLPIDLANFSVIIKGKNFRIEPSLGYLSVSSEYSNSGVTSESSLSNIRLGTVLAYNNSSIESMNFYYGIDFGVILSNISSKSSTSTESTDKSKTDFFIGPAVGGEYLFNKYFSLGGEINLNYVSVGEYDEDSGSTTWLMSTRGLIYLRWYLN